MFECLFVFWLGALWWIWFMMDWCVCGSVCLRGGLLVCLFVCLFDCSRGKLLVCSFLRLFAMFACVLVCLCA